MGEIHNTRLLKTLITFSTLFATIGLTVFLLGRLRTTSNEPMQMILDKRASWQKVAGTEGPKELLSSY